MVYQNISDTVELLGLTWNESSSKLSLCFASPKSLCLLTGLTVRHLLYFMKLYTPTEILHL